MKKEKNDMTAAALCDADLDAVTGGTMVDGQNVAGIHTLNQLSRNTSVLGQTLQDLSTGMQIARPQMIPPAIRSVSA